MHTRIQKIRKDANLTQAEFGKSLGATRAMIAFYEGNKVIPSKAMIIAICSKYNVNQHWLETGEGEPYKTSLIPDLIHALRNAPALLSALENLASRMTAEDWKILNNVVQKAIDSAKPPDDQGKKEEPGP